MKRKSTEGKQFGKKAKKAKLEGRIDGLASLDCARGIADTVQILRKETIEQFRTVGPLPLDVIPKTLVLTNNGLPTIAVPRRLVFEAPAAHEC